MLLWIRRGNFLNNMHSVVNILAHYHTMDMFYSVKIQNSLLALKQEAFSLVKNIMSQD